MRYSQELKKKIEELYISNNMSVRELKQELKKMKVKHIPPNTTIGNWIRSGNWRKRREKVNEKVLQQREEIWVKDKAKVTKLLQAAITKALKDFSLDKYKASLGDIERLLNLVMKINGINLDQTNVTVNNNTNEISVKAILLQVAEARKKLDENKPLMEIER